MTRKNLARFIGLSVLLAVTVAIAAEVTTVTGVGRIKLNVSEASWRYKMTVDIETSEGLKTGSAVREVIVKQVKPEIQGLYETRKFVKGEAVVIDLGKRGVLFAIMGSDDYYNVFDNFGVPDTGGDWVIAAQYYRDIKGKKKILKPEQYPQMVMFKDINDSKSVTLVKGWRFDIPTQKQIPVDNFEEIYGKDVRVKDVYVEITDEPVTKGIEKWLEWLPINKGGYLDGQFAGGGPELSNILHGGNFKTGAAR